MRFRASDVAAATGGTVVGEDVDIDGASFDTRTLRRGNLFVPIVADRDGHGFIGAAAKAGAAATLTAEGPDMPRAAGIPSIEVGDTTAALIDLATWGACRLDAIVVAITGSVGKTTTKDFAAAAIGAGRSVTANERSYNNEQGLPVTVLNAADGVDVVVLEMGMRGFGEIARLCVIAPPRIGIVTAVAAAHTARLGGIDEVARAKAELVEALPADGLAILNADDARVRAMSRMTAAPVLMFGESTDADIAVEGVTLDELARPSFRVRTPWGSADVSLRASGRHLVSNAAAAITAAGALGVDVGAAAHAVAGATLSASRMAVHRLESGAVVIDDAYNANPTSMTAALEALAAIPANRRVAVVGLMAELDDTAAAHQSVADRAAADRIELIAVGTDLYGVAPCVDPVAAVGQLGEGTAVLVKASRVAGLERVAAALVTASTRINRSMTTRYRDAVTTEPAPAGEQTMATLAKLTADRFGGTTAARFLRGGEWQQLTYNELWDRVRDLALGLARLGVSVGDRVAILANTRVEFTIADLAASTAGAVVVPVYPSNSPEECEWVVGDSGSKVIVCENPDQVAKIALVRENLPSLEHVVVIDGEADGALTMDEAAASGREEDASQLEERARRVAADDACLIIYTSGTTGRPKGVVLTNRAFAAARRTGVEINLFGPGALVYLYLPLAHVFAQLVQATAFEIGAPIAYWGGDPTRIVAELGEVKPDVLPSVPRIFEKVYAAAMAMIPADGHAEVAAAIELGNRVRDARLAGEEVSAEDAAEFDRVDNELFPLVRGIFGGNIGLAISGAAPIAPEILRFFYACGVPVMEGWGMTETTGIGTVNLPEAHRFGTIGRAVPAAQIRIANDGEIEIAGDVLLREYWNNPEATAETFTSDGYLKTGDLGSIDADGYVTITGRKKDIIITAGGKNLTPANLEGDLRRSQWISQVVMYGDRKPYPVAIVTLDAEVVLPWAEANGLPADVASLARNEQVVTMIQEELDAVNAKYARVEQIKRFMVLDRDFTIDSGELTPSLKLKRNAVYTNLAEEFERLYM